MKKIYILSAIFISGLAQSQIINFPDANLKAKLLAAATNNSIASSAYPNSVNIVIDTNGDGEIQVSEALIVKSLNFSTTGSSNIANLTGLENFSNLLKLNASSSQITSFIGFPSLKVVQMSGNQLASVDITNCPLLEEVNFYNNNLTAVNLSGNPLLKKLFVGQNDITSIDFSPCPQLVELGYADNQLAVQPNTTAALLPNLTSLSIGKNPFTYNQSMVPTGLKVFGCDNLNLTTLNLTEFTALEQLGCSYNQLTSLLLGSPELSSLSCQYNQLDSIDFGPTHKIASLQCFNNVLTSLDLSAQTIANVGLVDCRYNLPLLSVNLKNGFNNTSYFPQIFTGNSNVQFVCVDESEVEYFTTSAATAGLTNCVINGYCDFGPGGVAFIVNGTIRFDANGNGCDASDDVVQHQNIKYGTNNYAIADDSGTYDLLLTGGNKTLTPILENPTYFTVTPPTATFALSASNAPYTQNFCLTPNGVHPNVEVAVFPITDARPGFAAKYKIIYRNKGNQQASGAVHFNFNDAVMNFTSAVPVHSSQVPNTASWNYSDLEPFESRAIEVNFILNAPTSVPPLNANVDLSYQATISQTLTDDTPLDNTFSLVQRTVNAFDPNDKVCLQGQTVSATVIGNYVHYRIRFENTGSANAVNIVVKDIIDSVKFDVASLIPLGGSHDFVTLINSNTVEFIFENIQLPFDDANNDGYVVFKIKTKPTLVVGNTFSNAASIYFDYNHPIVTQPAVTTISVLQTKDFEFSDYFSVYPNPAIDVLNIQSKNNINITSAEIYNMLGQLVIAVTHTEEVSRIDVSHLTTGNYFIKIHSDKGVTNSKFTKK